MASFTPEHHFAKRFKYMVLAALSIWLIISGCASYGKLSLVPRHETDALVEDLLTRTDQYVVHYHGNSQKLVSGILFDPKDDERQLRPEGAMWQAISDPEAIAVIVFTILTASEPGYFPNVYQVTDPEGAFYGYLITGWTGLAVEPVDEQTLKVYGLKGPPEYENVSPGGR
jgi:hypothetical protein